MVLAGVLLTDDRTTICEYFLHVPGALCSYEKSQQTHPAKRKWQKKKDQSTYVHLLEDQRPSEKSLINPHH